MYTRKEAIIAPAAPSERRAGDSRPPRTRRCTSAPARAAQCKLIRESEAQAAHPSAVGGGGGRGARAHCARDSRRSREAPSQPRIVREPREVAAQRACKCAPAEPRFHCRGRAARPLDSFGFVAFHLFIGRPPPTRRRIGAPLWPPASCSISRCAPARRSTIVRRGVSRVNSSIGDKTRLPDRSRGPSDFPEENQVRS